jgi:hypothetical protein
MCRRAKENNYFQDSKMICNSLGFSAVLETSKERRLRVPASGDCGDDAIIVKTLSWRGLFSDKGVHRLREEGVATQQPVTVSTHVSLLYNGEAAVKRQKRCKRSETVHSESQQ